MIELDPGERAYMVEMRMLTTDAHGREVLVALDVEESEFYVRHSRAQMSMNSSSSREDESRYLALCNRHELARLQVLAAENALRVLAPNRH